MNSQGSVRPVLLVALELETLGNSSFMHSSSRKWNSLATVHKELKQVLTDAIGMMTVVQH